MTTNYKGSEATRNMVAEQIAERFGEAEVGHYDPYKNCMTFRQWIAAGFRVKRGEKALKSVTYIEVKDEHDEVIKKYPKTVNLFYIKQVEKVKT
ncbi:MAG: ArdC-like ssDNA-binding domain-containing protein [bacterium]